MNLDVVLASSSEAFVREAGSRARAEKESILWFTVTQTQLTFPSSLLLTSSSITKTAIKSQAWKQLLPVRKHPSSQESWVSLMWTSSERGACQVNPASFMVPECSKASFARTTLLLKIIPCSKHSYKMTEGTDGFFETYTCCFSKKKKK